MRRDLHLIRQILFKLETDQPCNVVDGVDETTITKHLELLLEAGLIKGIAHETDQQGVFWVDVDRLTWAGHDFLDAARNEEIWNQTKKLVTEKTGSVSFEMVKLVLVKLGKTALRKQEYLSKPGPELNPPTNPILTLKRVS